MVSTNFILVLLFLCAHCLVIKVCRKWTIFLRCFINEQFTLMLNDLEVEMIQLSSGSELTAWFSLNYFSSQLADAPLILNVKFSKLLFSFCSLKKKTFPDFCSYLILLENVRYFRSHWKRSRKIRSHFVLL